MASAAMWKNLKIAISQLQFEGFCKIFLVLQFDPLDRSDHVFPLNYTFA